MLTNVSNRQRGSTGDGLNVQAAEEVTEELLGSFQGRNSRQMSPGDKAVVAAIFNLVEMESENLCQRYGYGCECN